MVQGLGFRPFVYRQALVHGLHGQVANAGDGVHIYINGDARQAASFLHQLLHHAPAGSHIVHHTLQEVAHQQFTDFSIIGSDTTRLPQMLITPDLALCESCRSELLDSTNRRYSYSFITCTSCGPRFSILHGLPYDREATSMQAFEPCSACAQEYDDVTNNRYYSQTNSCRHCGVSLFLYDKNGLLPQTTTETIINTVAAALKEGALVALKSIGGYLLLCNAADANVVQRLRHLKHRPGKPLAVLFAHLQQAREYAALQADEEALLCSAIAPIVITPATMQAYAQLPMDVLAPGLPSLGVMLPYAPLLELLMQAVNRPLVATSANISSSPVLYKDEEARAMLQDVADLFVVHNRSILLPQDDSVMMFAPQSRQRIWLRRGRGLAPSMPGYALQEERPMLAMGAMMKSSFTLTSPPFVYTSQYLGNTASFDAQLSFQHSLAYMQELLQQTPAIVLADQHPQYITHQLAAEYVSKHTISEYRLVQHHRAHAAAILGEHRLCAQAEPVLVLAWDGTGLGEDGQVWGSEFFRYEARQLQRVKHLEYRPHLLGDKMAREPRLCALSWFGELPETTPVLRPLFREVEWPLYHKMRMQPDLYTSSLGRLFDAVAALLGITRQQYEGQAAMQLEALARAAQQTTQAGYYPVDAGDDSSYIPVRSLLKAMLADKLQQTPASLIAWRFHQWLVDVIAMVATQQQVKHIACSGGVFQNSLLVDLLTAQLGGRYRLYFHTQLPPNDENISFGQMVYWDQNIDDVKNWRTPAGHTSKKATVTNNALLQC